MLKILFWAFLISLKLLILKISGVDFVEKDAQFEKVLMTFGDFWMGISRKTEKNRFFFVQGGAFMGACLSGENGQKVNFRKVVLAVFKKKDFFKHYGGKVKIRFVFPYISKVVKFSVAPGFWASRKFCKSCVFWGGGGCMLGWWSFFWGGGGNSLGSKPSLFFVALLLFCYCYYFVTCFVSCFVFFFENNIQ